MPRRASSWRLSSAATFLASGVRLVRALKARVFKALGLDDAPGSPIAADR
jgi:hypothetical protein